MLVNDKCCGTPKEEDRKQVLQVGFSTLRGGVAFELRRDVNLWEWSGLVKGELGEGTLADTRGRKQEGKAGGREWWSMGWDIQWAEKVMCEGMDHRRSG